MKIKPSAVANWVLIALIAATLATILISSIASFTQDDSEVIVKFEKSESCNA